jgi:hypothetical protein
VAAEVKPRRFPSPWTMSDAPALDNRVRLLPFPSKDFTLVILKVLY